MGASVTALPLWPKLTGQERKLYGQQFVEMNLDELAGLTAADFALLLQWFFAEKHSCDATYAGERDSGIDIVFNNRAYEREEYLRAFRYTSTLHPHALADFLDVMQDTPVGKMRLYTLGSFTEAQKRTEHDHPLFLEFVDGEILTRRLREAQRDLKQPTVLYAPPEYLIPEERAARSQTDPISLSEFDIAPTPAASPDSPVGAEPREASQRLERMQQVITKLGGGSFVIPRRFERSDPALEARFAALVRLPARKRSKQLWTLLNESPEAFMVGIRHVFTLLGCHVATLDRPSHGGIVLKLITKGQTGIAYCTPSLVASTAGDVDYCAGIMQSVGASRGYVVTRAGFAAGAIERGRELGIELVSGEGLRKWL